MAAPREHRDNPGVIAPPPLLWLGALLIGLGLEYLWPLSLDFEIEGSRIHLVHIPPKQAPPGVDLLFHGHTHVPRNELVGRTRFFNPGCITRPNRGAPASYAWLELQRGRPADWMIVKV